MAIDPKTPIKAPRGLILAAAIALVSGLGLTIYGIWMANLNGLVFGLALLTVAALLGLSVMNRMFPKR